MRFDDYQEQAHQTSKDTVIGGDALLYPVLGLAGETGEFIDKIKKIHRDNGGVIDEERRVALALELGDLQWYLAEICTQLDISLSGVAWRNLEKLADRAKRGKIGGSGDDR